MGRIRVVAGCALALVTAALLRPSAAATPPAEGSVLLSLANRAGASAELHRLARSGKPARTALAHLAPDASHRAAVLLWAKGQGLDVERADRWSVTVSGPEARLKALFPGGSGDDLDGSLLAVPAGLRSHVTRAHGLDDAPVMRPHLVPFGLTGTLVRQRYGVPLLGWTGAGVTVGTLNLTGWDPTDLTAYANAAGLTIAPGQVSTIAVDSPANPLVPDGSGNDLEVAMDAQAILATAPAAKQRQYFAPNNGVGTIDVLNQMAADGEAGLLQVASTSWGLCEPSSPAWYRDAVGQAVDRMLAAGVTLFAASGDSGRYDCSYPDAVDNSSAVDFPASYPGVVAVGGTRAGLAETGWGSVAASPGTSYAGNGSGGGPSASYARPSWQGGLSNPGTTRLVPDVAAVADPSTGFGIVNRGQWWLGGGTSLAAPMWAGLTAAALSGAGRATGLGDIHPLLYAHPEAFRDVTAGDNGYAAGPGYDLVTGLGVPRWDVLGPLLTATAAPDVTAPTATATAALVTGTDSRVRFGWSGKDAAPSSGLASYAVSVSQVGGGTVWSATTAATSQVLSLTPGRAYTVTARAKDLAGLVSAPATATVAVPYDDAAPARTGTWSREYWSADYRGSHLVSRTAGSSMSLTVTGRSVTLGLVTSASGGYVDVYVDGRRTTRVDAWSTVTRARQQVRVATWTASGRHTVRLVVTGAHRLGAIGTWVRVDSLTVSP
jgi:kumamolisin